MLVYVFGKKFEADLAPSVQQFLEKMVRRGISICVFKSFERFLESHIQIPAHTTFEENSEFENAAALFSFGGDGTFLDAARLVGQDDPEEVVAGDDGPVLGGAGAAFVGSPLQRDLMG